MTLPLLDLLSVTKSGFIGGAAEHQCERRRGVPEAIVLLCVAGRGELSVGSERVPVVPNQAVIIPPGVAHRYRASRTAPWSIWWMHVRGNDVPTLLRSVLSVHKTPVFDVNNMTDVLACMNQADQMTGDLTPAARCLAAGAAWRLFTLLAVGAGIEVDSRSAVIAIRNSIAADPSVDIHVPSLAARAGVSVSRFSVLFQDAAGTGVVTFTRRARMSRAKQLLVQGNLPVVTIARLVGYKDPLYFSRLFRADTGLSPTAYRRSQRAG